MKKMLFIAILSLVCIGVNAQDRLSFEKVIKADSVSKNDIYVSVKEWIGINYVSAKAITEIDDKEAGLIIVSPLTDYGFNNKLTYACYSGTLKYVVKFQIRDNRFKVEITNFVHDVKIGNSQGCRLGILTVAEETDSKAALKSYNDKVWADLKQKAEVLANNLFERIESIEFNNSSNSEDDW
jgi:hypothetical protein